MVIIFTTIFDISKTKNMTTSNTLTAEQIKRVNQSIVETERVIAKQKSYSVDLRDNVMIASYEKHLVNLKNMVNAN